MAATQQRQLVTSQSAEAIPDADGPSSSNKIIVDELSNSAADIINDSTTSASLTGKRKAETEGGPSNVSKKVKMGKCLDTFRLCSLTLC